MNAAIIPARGGSRRIPHKNTRMFRGRPIIEYSIDAAQKSGLFESIYVSTDDQHAMDIAKAMGCHIHLRSSQFLCGDDAGTQEVAQDCLIRSTGAKYEHACVIYPCAPMMLPSDLVFGLRLAESVRETYRYVYMPAWFYWGLATTFMNMRTLGAGNLCLTPDATRWADINTEDDWQRAEEMYAALHKGGA